MADTPMDERRFTDQEVHEILKRAVEKAPSRALVKSEVTRLWTGEDEILRLADERYEAVIGPLNGPERRAVRFLRTRHSGGLDLDVVEVRYLAFGRTGVLRLSLTVDSAPHVPPETAWEIVTGARPEAWGEPPEGEIGRVWEDTLNATLTAAHPEIESTDWSRYEGPLGVSDRIEAHGWRWVEDPPGSLRHRVEAQIWSQVPGDTTRLRFEAGGGEFIDWLHHPWLSPNGATCPGEDEAREVVEARAEFPDGYRFHESEPDSHSSSHRDLYWKRYGDGDLVEHDTAYASVRGGDLEIGQLLAVASPLDPRLDLNEGAGDAALGDAFRERFPDSVRCGEIRRVYVQIEGERTRRLAWVGNAIDQGRPIEVAVGSGGEVIRVQLTG